MREPANAAKEPFIFYTRLHLTELTGLRASSLKELLHLIRTVPGSSIYHHTHRFLQMHQYLSPEPPNDFAYWIKNALGYDLLAERLASIDTVEFSSIRELRESIAATIESFIASNPAAAERGALRGDEFHFMKSTSFVLSTGYEARNLYEFADILEKISVQSIYYHMFEARLRLEKGSNDFSSWLENSLKEKKLAHEISKLDPYTYAMEDLRGELIKLVRGRPGGRL